MGLNLVGYSNIGSKMYKAMDINQLLKKHKLVSDQVDPVELLVILNELKKKLEKGERGAVVEFGCYVGTTSLFLRRLIDYYELSNDFHVYDSFAGLPEKIEPDLSPTGEQFKAGELSASKKDFILNFKKANLRLPVIHKGWFNELAPDDIPDGISFAFLDGDYYESIKDSLKLIWPKLTENSVIIVDDYGNEALPGARKAVDEWLKNHPAKLYIESSLAILQPGLLVSH